MRGARLRFVAAALACGCAQPIMVASDGGMDSAPDVASVKDAGDATTDAGSCTDGVKDGTETDVDCGGSLCPKCADGKSCVLVTDCASNVCSAGTCGTRAWSAESNGNDVLVAGNQTWVTASGLDLQPTLYAPALVFLRWTGTLRWAGGGNGLCHVGQRFVIDDVPTGDVNWGNSIMVENGTTRFHEMFTTETAVPLVLGLHTISVQMVNAAGYGDCYLDGDSGAAYDRSRLTVSAHDPNNAWYVESTAETGAVGATFTDIPGVSTSITLAESRHVQASLTGTQSVGGTGEGYCAYRFVIDGTPLGEPTYGQAIAIGDVATGWWAPVSLKYGVDMMSGAHTIKAQVSNTSTTGTCNAGQGNNGYARFRMFVTSNPTGGPNASAESSGGPFVLGSLSAWTPIGLSTTFSVTAPTQVQLEMAGTENTSSGTSGQCSWHFVVDGTPLGDPNYGQAINVGSTATTWWTAMSMLWGQPFDAGMHTVSVEVRNSSSSGNCGANGNAMPYGYERLLVRAP